MEGAAMDLATGASHELDSAGEHFLRGPSGEGEQEDALGRDAGLDQVGDAIDERTGFSRSGARNY
jgi:hypothetical protein